MELGSTLLGTRKIAQILGVPYHIVDNMVRYGLITPKLLGKGTPRVFNVFDVTLAKLALLMREDGFSRAESKQAIEVYKQWLLSDDKNCGMRAWKTTKADGSTDTSYRFTLENSLIIRVSDSTVETIEHIPYYWYDITTICNRLIKSFAEHGLLD